MVETSFGTLDIDLSTAPAPKSATPFRIGVLSDFSGRASRLSEPEAIAGRRWTKVDIDEFDDTVASFKATLNLSGLASDDITVYVQSIDNLDADDLVDRVEQFSDYDKPAEKAKFLRSILHHPHFRAMEATWRGIHWLIKHMPPERKIEIHLLDATWDEVIADLNSNDDLSQCALYELMAEWPNKPKGEPWGAFVGDFVFQPTVEHANILGRLAKLARASHAPFLAGIDAKIMDKAFRLTGDDDEAWQALRQLPESNILGLATPGFLLRMPYGLNGKSVEKFAFEEHDQTVKGKAFLWGNPGLGCAALLGQGFAKDGWGFKPGAILDLENMPMYVFEDDFDKIVTVAERWVTAKDSQQTSKVGAMALMAVKGKDALHLSQFVSLADGSPPLAGPWQKGAGVPKAPGKPSVRVGVAMAAGGAAATAAAAQSFAEKKGNKSATVGPAKSFAERKGINLEKAPGPAQSFAESGGGDSGSSSDDSSNWDPNRALYEELRKLSPEEMKARFGPKEEESTETPSDDFSSFGDSTDTSMDLTSDSSSESTESTDTNLDELLAGLGTSENPPAETPAEESSGASSDLDELLKGLEADEGKG